MRTPNGMASITSTSTTAFMAQSYHPRNATASVPGDDSPGADPAEAARQEPCIAA